MKVIVAGSRFGLLRESDVLALEEFHEKNNITELVSGGCRGIDHEAEQWARFIGIPVKEFPADWDTHGRSAGPKRNRQMAEYADACILFYGTAGTESMYREAVRAGIAIYDWRKGKGGI